MVKLIVYCPVATEPTLRLALAEAGIGKQGAYDSWSVGFDVTERFRPLKGSNPLEGTLGQLTQTKNRRLEFQVPKSRYREIIRLICALHPYESPAIEVIPLLYPTSTDTNKG